MSDSHQQGSPGGLNGGGRRAADGPPVAPQLQSADTAGPDSLDHNLLRSESVASVLHRAAALAKRSLPAAEEASVTLSTAPRRATAAWTGLMAYELDECQYGLGFGPCLEAAEGGHLVLVADTQTEDRWPAFTPLALRQGVRSILSVPIPIGDTARAGLNLYSTSAGAFDDDRTIAKAERLAGQAAVVIGNLRDLAAARAEVEQLQTALASRAGIEQAKGILMAIHGCDADQAFQTISTQSQKTNTKVRDIAASILAQVRQHPEASDPGT